MTAKPLLGLRTRDNSLLLAHRQRADVSLENG